MSCPSSIQCWDSKPQPLKHELTPITTRPGLLPYATNVCCAMIGCSNFPDQSECLKPGHHN